MNGENGTNTQATNAPSPHENPLVQNDERILVVSGECCDAHFNQNIYITIHFIFSKNHKVISMLLC